MALSPDEIERYKRHLLLPEIGGQGQQRLKAARVVVIGAGGLGCPLLSYLAAAGAGHLRIVDGDTVALSNLQRQTLYTTDDIGKPKADVAAARLRALNPEITIEAVNEPVTEDNAAALVADVTLVVEGVDRYAPRYIVNAACLALGLPFLSAAIGRFDGQVALFEPGVADRPCYACLVPEAPTDEALCETDGVFGAVPGIVGALAAQETIKWLCRMEGRLQGELLIYGGLAASLRRVRLPRDPDCPVCG